MALDGQIGNDPYLGEGFKIVMPPEMKAEQIKLLKNYEQNYGTYESLLAHCKERQAGPHFLSDVDREELRIEIGEPKRVGILPGKIVRLMYQMAVTKELIE